jgi:hypothetical protein
LSNLIVPQHIIDENRRYEQVMFDNAVRSYMDHVKGILDEFNYELQKIDPRLELMRAGEAIIWQSTEVQPGYYFVVRHNDPPAPPSIMPWQTPEGGFREPDSGIFEMLRKNDLWNPATKHRAKKQAQKLQEAEDRRRAQERADRQRELHERYLAATRTQVSMNRDIPWHQNAAGRRGRKLNPERTP